MSNTNYIHEYIYDKRRQLKGVWAATPNKIDQGKVYIGYSLCNKRRGDKFSKSLGLSIAIGRSYEGSAEAIPMSLIEGYNFFVSRCRRYYKDRNVVG